MKSSKLTWIIVLAAIALLASIYYIYSRQKAPTGKKVTWGTALSDRYLWPMMVSNATFLTPDGVTIGISEFGNEQYQPLSGKWGVGVGDDDGNYDELPIQLSVDWLSLREKRWYKGIFKLPIKQLDSIYSLVKGKQLIVGLDTAGRVVLWVKGKLDTREITAFSAEAYQPDWQRAQLSNKETEQAFIGRVYNLVNAAERDAIAIAQDWREQQATDGSFSGIYEYIAQMEMDGEHLLLVHKQKDSIALIDPGTTPKNLFQGDLIWLDWKVRAHSSNRDSVAAKKMPVATNVKLYRKGKLARLIQTGMPGLTPDYQTGHISEQGKVLLLKAVSYYLANTSDTVIRNAVDHHKEAFSFTVADQDFKGNDGYKIGLSSDAEHSSLMRWLYYAPRRPFSLFTWDELADQ